MTDENIWITFWLLYMVPFLVWNYVSMENSEIRRKLRPKSGSEIGNARLRTRLGYLWLLGLLASVAAYKLEFDPIASIAAVTVALFLIFKTFMSYFSGK